MPLGNGVVSTVVGHGSIDLFPSLHFPLVKVLKSSFLLGSLFSVLYSKFVASWRYLEQD